MLYATGIESYMINTNNIVPFRGITVIVPTNRYKCIETLIGSCISKYNGSLFRFKIYDSSEDLLIKKCIQRHNASHLDRQVYYYHCVPGIGADRKAIEAIKSENSEFFWLYGDGNNTDFGSLEKILLQENFQNFDIIDLETADRRGILNQDQDKKLNRIYTYHNAYDFSSRYFSHLTYWGGSIVRNSFYKNIFTTGRMQVYEDHQIPWWIACTLLDLIANKIQSEENVHLGVMYSDTLTNNKEKLDHGWTQDERYYQITFVKLLEGVSLMSSWYPETIKKQMVKGLWDDSLANFRYLLHLRRIGNLNPRMVQKYKNEIKTVPAVYRRMKVISSIPQPVIQMIYRFKKRIKP